MKKLALALTAFAAMTGSVSAADLAARPYTKAPVVAAPVASWTGCYLGAGGGGAMTNNDSNVYDVATGTQLTGNITHGARGWFGTVQGGCDYQFNENWVIGVFGDYDWSGIRGNINDVIVGGGGPLVGREKLSSAWAVGGRVGYLVNPQFLTYFSGGYTEANFDVINLSTLGGVLTAVYPEQTSSGWFLGSGYEYKLPWFSGLSWKTEYRFSYLDRETLTRFTPAGVATAFSMDSQKYVQTIRSELVWRFNFWR